jgi:hypothetical protein
MKYDSESKDSFSIHLPIHHLYHLHKFLFGEYPFLHQQSSKGFLLDYLGHEEFFGGDVLFGVNRIAMPPPSSNRAGYLTSLPLPVRYGYDLH